jgi:hypothetical protein
MLPSQQALEEAVALMTSAAGPVDELDELVHRALDEQPAPDLVLALVALGRSLCYTAARLVHVIDDDLSDAAAMDLTDEAVQPAAMSVLQSYGRQVARTREHDRH